MVESTSEKKGEIASNPNGHENVKRSHLFEVLRHVDMKQQSIPYIYRVPEKLRKLNKSAYSPRLLSIGPLHKDDKHLKEMEDYKVRFMNRLFLRTTISDKNQISHETLEYVFAKEYNCMIAMSEDIAEARFCYEVKCQQGISEVEFAEMMFIDGCFILELLYTSQAKEDNMSDPIFTNALVSVDIRHDLLLLENQIPFPILQKLFQLTVEQIPHRPNNLKLSLTEFILNFFGNLLNLDRKITKNKDDIGDNHYHILHLLLKCYLPQQPCQPQTRPQPQPRPILMVDYSNIKDFATDHQHDPEAGKGKELDMEDNSSSNTSCWFSWLCGIKTPSHESLQQEDHRINKYTATELDRAGVGFQAGKGEVLDVDFSTCSFSWLCGSRLPNSHGKTLLTITPISIYDGTESFLRNLIAFEQCYPFVGRRITSYAFLMDTLINAKEDVGILEKAEVLQNNLGTCENASNLFNNICKEVILGDFYFLEQWKHVDDYCNRCYPRHMASLREKYFSSPWTIISVIAALILFALTVVQTVYTIRYSG